MDDPDATVPMFKSTPQAGAGGLSPQEVGNLMAVGAEAFESRRTSRPRAWNPPSTEELQKMLPQYEISGFIARGGMGAVYKGVQRALDRTVAIKILPPEIVDDGEANYAQRFKQEARAMAKFKHPGIVTVYEAGEAELQGQDSQGAARQESQGGKLLYFVMEFIEGTDVAQLVATHGQLPPQEAIRITTAVCDALAYAHARGVVHRDIKPSNIMIDADGQVKVADFGLAKVTAHDSSGITRSSVTMGTPDFVAPEAMLAGTLVDQRADIYAVGVMLYQMLTGHIPRGRFSPISAVVPQSDPKLDAIVDKAMQTDREKRYSSAVEMKTEVEAVAAPAKAWSGDASSDHRLAPAATSNGVSAAAKTRRKMSMLVGAAAVIVLGAGAFWMTRKDEEGRAAGPAAAASAPSAALAGASALPSATVSIPGLPDLPPLAIPAGEPGLVKEITLAPQPFLHRIALLPDSRRMLAFKGSRVELLDLQTEGTVWSVDAGGDAEAVAVSRDGSRFAHYRYALNRNAKDFRPEDQKAVITLRATKDGSVIQSWTVPVGLMSVPGGSLAMAPFGRRLVARVGADKSGKGPTTFVALDEGHAEPVARWSVAEHNGHMIFCVDEDHFLSTGNGPAMLLTVAQPGKAEVFAQTGAELNSAISPDGLQLVTCDRSAGMAVWDTSTRQRLRNLEGAPQKADLVAISRSGAVVMMGDAVLRDKNKATPQAYSAPFGIWDSHTGKRLATLSPPRAGQTYNGSSSATIADNSTFFATVARYDPPREGGGANVVQIWRLPAPLKPDKAKTSAATGLRWPHMPTEEDRKLAFTNTLGMKFVPVPGTEVLFCIHETRKQDYAAYAAAVPKVDALWRQPAFYRDTPVSPTPDHPVAWVNLGDCQGFCAWLSTKEGRKYRLPSDYEWSCAVGISEREDREALPTVRGAVFISVFAWGTQWPPPKGAGNLGDETLKRVTGQEPVITGYDDGFATTAPVMSFPPNALGIHDLAGNVWEFCSDWYDSLQQKITVRGSSYNNGNPEPNAAFVAAVIRNGQPQDRGAINTGFRIVAERLP
ncbi:MAG: protein kinase [Prosthecobacter sp.]|nr:protein kinase [Prosthecobacter sp.]